MSVQHRLAFQGRGRAPARKSASRPVSRVLYGREPRGSRRDGHSSGTPVAGRLEQPTRATRPADWPRGALQAPRIAPIRSCSRRGLPCRRRCRRRGALLPHPFTLAGLGLSLAAGGLLSVALSLGSPPPDVIRRRVRMEPGLSSAREKPAKRRPSGRLAGRGIGARARRGSSAGVRQPAGATPTRSRRPAKTSTTTRIAAIAVSASMRSPSSRRRGRGSGTAARAGPGRPARRRRAPARRSRRRSRDTCSSRRDRRGSPRRARHARRIGRAPEEAQRRRRGQGEDDDPRDDVARRHPARQLRRQGVADRGARHGERAAARRRLAGPPPRCSAKPTTSARRESRRPRTPATAVRDRSARRRRRWRAAARRRRRRRARPAARASRSW